VATYLYRLGGWAFRRRRAVLCAWLAVLVAAGASAALFAGQTSNKFEVPGTESQQAQELLHKKFPGAGGAQARMVFAAPKGESLNDEANKDAVMASMAEAKKSADVIKVVDPYSAKTMTKDGRIAFGDVIYPVPSDQIDEQAKDELAETAKPARDAGLQVEFSGGVVTDTSQTNSESLGMMVAFVVLASTMVSLLAAGLPLITAALGVLIGVSGLTALSGVIDVSETAPILATMLGLAVGIDYALFILSRHRQNLGDGLEPSEAAAQATATAGSAVVFAGATVIIALVGLTVVNIPFLTVMGLAAAGTVLMAVLIAITLLPAAMGFAGSRLGRVNRVLGFRPSRGERRREKFSVRWAGMVTRHPLPVVLVSLALLLTAALPAMHMKLGLPDDGSQPTNNTERKAYDLLTEGFGPGFNGPLTGVVDAPGLSEEEQKQLAQDLAKGLEDFPGVAAVSEPMQNETGDVTIVQVTPTTGPSSDETKDLVTQLRKRADEVHERTGIDAFVTGTTALNIDTADTLNAALPKYIVVVVGLALLLLMVVFRSILVPLKAAAGFLLSIAASMGVVVWIFQDGNLADFLGVSQPGPIVSFLPILLIGILFGLAMDYEVFLVSRMREAFVHGDKARDAVVKGFGHSGRVVTAAAIIMTAVFGAFILDEDPIVKSIGLSLAVGVLADAFIVRMTLVPAVMALLGRRAWWMPRQLGRIVPNLDIEGEELMKGLKKAPVGS
jgi:membrane protein YdfJ